MSFIHVKQSKDTDSIISDELTEKAVTMKRKEIPDAKSLHPWRQTNSLFSKKRKFLLCSCTKALFY